MSARAENRDPKRHSTLLHPGRKVVPEARRREQATIVGHQHYGLVGVVARPSAVHRAGSLTGWSARPSNGRPGPDSRSYRDHGSGQ